MKSFGKAHNMETRSNSLTNDSLTTPATALPAHWFLSPLPTSCHPSPLLSAPTQHTSRCDVTSHTTMTMPLQPEPRTDSSQQTHPRTPQRERGVEGGRGRGRGYCQHVQRGFFRTLPVCLCRPVLMLVTCFTAGRASSSSSSSRRGGGHKVLILLCSPSTQLMVLVTITDILFHSPCPHLTKTHTPIPTTTPTQ